MDGGLEFEAAGVAALVDSGAVGGGVTEFQGGLHDGGTDEVGVIDADGVAELVGCWTPVGIDERVLRKGRDLRAA